MYWNILLAVKTPHTTQGWPWVALVGQETVVQWLICLIITCSLSMVKPRKILCESISSHFLSFWFVCQREKEGLPDSFSSPRVRGISLHQWVKRIFAEKELDIFCRDRFHQQNSPLFPWETGLDREFFLAFWWKTLWITLWIDGEKSFFYVENPGKSLIWAQFSGTFGQSYPHIHRFRAFCHLHLPLLFATLIRHTESPGRGIVFSKFGKSEMREALFLELLCYNPFEGRTYSSRKFSLWKKSRRRRWFSAPRRALLKRSI